MIHSSASITIKMVLTYTVKPPHGHVTIKTCLQLLQPYNPTDENHNQPVTYDTLRHEIPYKKNTSSTTFRIITLCIFPANI